MKTTVKPFAYCILMLFFVIGEVKGQKEEIWKEATIMQFDAPYEQITINLDNEDFVFNITDKTKFIIGKKKSFPKERIFSGSTIDLALVIENRKRVLTKIIVSEDDYGKLKKFQGVFESFNGDEAFIDGRKVALTEKTTIKCEGSNDCACTKGRSFLGFDELELGSFLTVSGDKGEDGTFKADKISVCKNTYGQVDQEFMTELIQNFDASNLTRVDKVPAGIFKTAQGLHNGNIKLGNVDYKLLDDIRVQGYINMIGNRVLPEYVKNDGFSKEHGVDFRFYVLDNEVPNATALGNGMIFIHTGLLRLMENEAQIAAVLGHEIAHVTYEHSIKRYKASRITNSNMAKKATKWMKKAFMKKAKIKENTLLGNTLGSALKFTTPDNIMGLFNKKNETQSDRAGLYYMTEAGYDPREAANFWNIMMKNTSNQNFMGTLFKSTLTMVNDIDEDLEDVKLGDLGEDGMDLLVNKILETVYTSHPLVVKRLGDVNQLIASTYSERDFSALEIGKESFLKYLGRYKENQ